MARQQAIPAITRFGMVLPRRSSFDSFTRAEVRKVITRALSFDNKIVGQMAGMFTHTYIPGAQVSVSSMDDASMSRSQLANFVAKSRAYLAGDHWQGGAGWVGPWPRGGAAAPAAISDLQGRFVSHNVLAELIDRHTTGALGREPAWTMAPKRKVDDEHPILPAEQLLIDEANSFLTEWWDLRKAHETLLNACITMLFARRSPLRLYIPQGALKDVRDEAGNTRKMVLVEDFREALLTLWLDHPAPERATVACEDATKEELGAMLYEGGISITGDGQPNEVAELTYLDPATGVTVLRSIDKEFDVEWSADLGGRLLMHEMERPLFLTPQLQQQQGALNMALTMVPRNLVTAGFLQRSVLNAQMPGRWERDAVTGDPKGRWIPEPVVEGPAVKEYLQGVETANADGTVTRATPEIHDRQPVSPEPTISSIRALYELMLEGAAQAHVLMNADANASGKSREQARADFGRSLNTTAPRLERAGRWLMETLLATAEALSNQPGKYTASLRAVFTLRLDTGPVDALERQANDLSYKNGTLSRESAMSRNGVADVDAELALIDAQPGANLANIERMTTVFTTLMREGIAPEAAARIAGFEEEQIKALVAAFVEPDEPDDPDADPDGDDEDDGPPVSQ